MTMDSDWDIADSHPNDLKRALIVALVSILVLLWLWL